MVPDVHTDTPTFVFSFAVLPSKDFPKASIRECPGPSGLLWNNPRSSDHLPTRPPILRSEYIKEGVSVDPSVGPSHAFSSMAENRNIMVYELVILHFVSFLIMGFNHNHYAARTIGLSTLFLDASVHQFVAPFSEFVALWLVVEGRASQPSTQSQYILPPPFDHPSSFTLI